MAEPTTDAGSCPKDRTRQRLILQCFRRQSVRHAGDVQVAEICTAKSAAGHLASWHAHDPLQRAVKRIAMDCTAAVHSDPQTAFGVYSHTVGQANFWGARVT